MVKSKVSEWDKVAANNTDMGGITLDGAVMSPSLVDNAIRENMAQVATQLGDLGAKGADIASAATTNLANATGWYLDITGTTTITSFGTVDEGQQYTLRFVSALTLTHNATSLILPGAANITTAAGDVAVMMSLGSGNWRCIGYQRASNLPGDVTLTGTQTLTNKTLTTPTLTLKQSAAPVPTAEGAVEWDTDDNVLAIGDGAATKVFLPIPASTAAGDTEYFTAAKVKARLPKGAAGQRYQMNAGATGPEWADGVAGGTNIATTSGTAIDVTSIPAYAKEITINFSGVSTNGTSLVIVQLGDSGGIETSGYNGCTSGITNAVITNAHSSGFIVHTNNSAAATIHGSVKLTREDAATNTWSASITTGLSDAAYVSVGGGSKALSATLDRIRITTVAGTNTFDAGSLNVTYEG